MFWLKSKEHVFFWVREGRRQDFFENPTARDTIFDISPLFDVCDALKIVASFPKRGQFIHSFDVRSSVFATFRFPVSSRTVDTHVF